MLYLAVLCFVVINICCGFMHPYIHNLQVVGVGGVGGVGWGGGWEEGIYWHWDNRSPLDHPDSYTVSKIRKNIFRFDVQVGFELYGHLGCLQVLYSKWNYIHKVLSYPVDYKAPLASGNEMKRTIIKIPTFSIKLRLIENVFLKMEWFVCNNTFPSGHILTLTMPLILSGHQWVKDNERPNY